MTAATRDPFATVMEAIRNRGLKHHKVAARTVAERWAIQCPAHDDARPSAAVSRTHDGKVLFYCNTGCETPDIAAALGLTMGELFSDAYDYRDGERLVRTVRRKYDADGRKAFPQSGPMDAVTLYRLNEVRRAVAAGQVIYLTEGEKDAELLVSIGQEATTAPMGAANFGNVDVTPLFGAVIVAVVDRDPAGDKWALSVRSKLAGVAEVTFVTAAGELHDAGDHIAADLGPEEFEPYRFPPGNRAAREALAAAEATFTRWLGAEYDLDALRVMLATLAVERLDGDPLWLLLVSGSGNAKTETAQAAAGAGAMVISTISSEGALLSATSKRERTADATGGLLRQLEPRGVLVLKDVTTVLSMSREPRAMVLAALREVYDGRWARTVGTDGARILEWSGRIALVGAVTTAWDAAHAVIASMGDRFVLLRMDSTTGRQAAGRRAIGNTGSEAIMRTELAAAVAEVIAAMDTTVTNVTDDETDVLLAAADLVTLSRTGVEYDFRGDVINAHAPEMPTRFAKQLTQVLRGAVAVGMARADALQLAIRCARDSMPPLRLRIVDDLAAHPDSTTTDVRRRLDTPHNTVDRQLQALHLLGVITVNESDKPWRYRLTDGIESGSIKAERISRNVTMPLTKQEEAKSEALYAPTNISGNAPGAPVDLAAEQPQFCRRCYSHPVRPDATDGYCESCAATLLARGRA